MLSHSLLEGPPGRRRVDGRRLGLLASMALMVACSGSVDRGPTQASPGKTADETAGPAPSAASPAWPPGVTPLSPLPLDAAARRALLEAVDDARVVLLGESSHGAGNAFAWRAAIVALLHQELGFEHLVMESSFYDCRRAYVESSKHRDAARLARECSFDLWAEAVETEPLWRLVIDSAASPRPLRLWGMDPQLSGDVDAWLLEDLEALASALLPSHDAGLLRQTLAAVRNDEIERTADQRAAGAALLQELKRAFSARPAGWQPRTETRAFWSHTLDSILATEEDYWLYQLAKGKIDSTQHNLRERQMAANLIHLLEQHPEGRFVVWLHNGHALRRLEEVGLVDHGDHDHDFTRSETLGGLLTDALDPDPLILAVFSAAGHWALAGSEKGGDMPPQPPSSLVHRLADESIDRALIDLRRAPASWPWLDAALPAPILGLESTSARWPRHVDVLLFDKTMTPATSR